MTSFPSPNPFLASTPPAETPSQLAAAGGGFTYSERKLCESLGRWMFATAVLYFVGAATAALAAMAGTYTELDKGHTLSRVLVVVVPNLLVGALHCVLGGFCRTAADGFRAAARSDADSISQVMQGVQGTRWLFQVQGVLIVICAVPLAIGGVVFAFTLMLRR